jgi:hypothetical protein
LCLVNEFEIYFMQRSRNKKLNHFTNLFRC